MEHHLELVLENEAGQWHLKTGMEIYGCSLVHLVLKTSQGGGSSPCIAPPPSMASGRPSPLRTLAEPGSFVGAPHSQT